MTINQDQVKDRVDVWLAATMLAKPLIDEHGLEEYRTGVPPFTSSMTLTKVDQHIDQIIRVADWLLET